MDSALRRALLLAAVLGGTGPDPFAAAADAASLRAAVRSYRERHEIEILRELVDLLAIPNIAADATNIEKNAAWLISALRERGLRTDVLRVDQSPPVVYGELLAPRARRTVVFYAHYDGQPVDPKQWKGSPWVPVLRDQPLEQGGREISWDRVRAPIHPAWRLYARSSSDDKAPIVGLLAALDALRAAGIRPSVNLKFFFEGEEEAGSPHLPALLQKYAERLRGDLWLLLDGPVHQTRSMQLYFGARGVMGVEITAYGAMRRLHSGHYGNWAPNPIVELAHLVATMRDREGRIRIAGFSDDVRPLTEAERRVLSETPDVDASLRLELGLARTEGGDLRLHEAILRPALNLRGISGGDVGAQATNSIPTEATASIDLRLVPDQKPEKLRALVEEHFRQKGYLIVRDPPDLQTRLKNPRILRMVWGPGYPAARTSMDLPVSRAVVRVVEEAVGGPVVQLPSLGGSVPMYLFLDQLRTPVIGVPIVNHDNNQHAGNENLRIQNLWDGIEIFAALLAGLGERWR